MPSAPTLAITRLATVCPGTKLRFDASGASVPAGNTVSQPPALGRVTATLRTTASTPLTGTPPVPTTVSSRVSPAPSAAALRVSISRAGASGVYP